MQPSRLFCFFRVCFVGSISHSFLSIYILGLLVLIKLLFSGHLRLYTLLLFLLQPYQRRRDASFHCLTQVVVVGLFSMMHTVTAERLQMGRTAELEPQIDVMLSLLLFALFFGVVTIFLMTTLRILMR